MSDTRWEERFPCEFGCYLRGYPEQDCSRHGRTPDELRSIINGLNDQITDLKAKCCCGRAQIVDEFDGFEEIITPMKSDIPDNNGR